MLRKCQLSASFSESNSYIAINRMGYSRKGYIDGELLAEWVKHFDEQTKKKANGRPRYILVDGHKSRLHLPFLLYCRERNIHAICYPSHSTHVYQGLDVVVFSVLKRAFSDEMLKFEAETGQSVNKSNFLKVYTPAHARSFTPENIRMAFCKTGVIPYNPNIIQSSKLKPSVESSIIGHGLPLVPPTPVRKMASLMKNFHFEDTDYQNSDIIQERIGASGAPPVDPCLLSELSHATEELQQTSARFLFSSSPIKSSSSLPLHIPSQIQPFKVPKEVLTRVPETELEEYLQDALMELIKRESHQEGAIHELRANMVLQSIYCERLRGQLHARESVGKEKKGSGKLLGDGLPRILTGDDFVKKVQEFAQRQLEEEDARLQKRQEREQYASLLAKWKLLDGARKQKDKARTAEFKEEMRCWKEEQRIAKTEKRRPAWNKPVRGPREPVIPKPVRPHNEELEEIDINIDDVSEAESDY